MNHNLSLTGGLAVRHCGCLFNVYGSSRAVRELCMRFMSKNINMYRFSGLSGYFSKQLFYYKSSGSHGSNSFQALWERPE